MRVKFTPFLQWAAVGGAAIPAVAGFVLLVAQSLQSPSPGGEGTLPPAMAEPVVVYARPLCTFANEDARAALIDGADGGTSVVVGDRTFWLFGDTLFAAESGKRIEQNSIAWSQGRREEGCPKLEYHARDGIGVPFLPKDGSLTNWPVGAWVVDDRFLDIYVTYIYGTGPYAYWIGEIGVSRLDTQTMKVETLARVLWNADSGFRDQVVGAQPVEVGEDRLVRVVLETKASDKLLARVPTGSFHRVDAYEFWTGQGWSSSSADAVPLWEPVTLIGITKLLTPSAGFPRPWLGCHFPTWGAFYGFPLRGFPIWPRRGGLNRQTPGAALTRRTQSRSSSLWRTPPTSPSTPTSASTWRW